jgi:hypothetical protein
MRRVPGGGRTLLEVHTEVVECPQDLGMGAEEADREHGEERHHQAEPNDEGGHPTSQLPPQLTVM